MAKTCIQVLRKTNVLYCVNNYMDLTKKPYSFFGKTVGTFQHQKFDPNLNKSSKKYPSNKVIKTVSSKV